MKAVRFLMCAIALTVVFAGQTTGAAVEKWGVFEKQITNTKAYNNKFKDVSLSTTFTAPSGAVYAFRGFYDGDGNGGQSGSVWKIRFMPTESGVWSYTYRWSDNSPGGNGSFEVASGTIAGPLKVDSKDSWYFAYPDNSPFHARPYDLHHVGPEGYKNVKAFPTSTDWTDAFAAYKTVIDKDVSAGRYNMLMIDAPSSSGHPNGRCYWLNGSTTTFDVAVFGDYERIIRYCGQKGLYVFPFDGLATQSDLGKINDQFLEYLTARFGAFYNYMGYSATYEYTEKWSDGKMDTLMTKVKNLLPFPIVLSVHDHSASRFDNWMSFSMRQLEAIDIFTPNNRTEGGHGGVDAPFDTLPIIGSEDIWEAAPTYGYPQTAREVRHAAWGSHFAGIMPLYSEWHRFTATPGKLPGEAEVIRMFDFLHDLTDYRSYRQLNSLVSKVNGQICSGKKGHEYLVYDSSGGSVTINLSGESGQQEFSVLWFNPITGESRQGSAIKGGASRTLNAPAGYDEAVLLLQADDATVPAPPGASRCYPQRGSALFTMEHVGKCLNLGFLGEGPSVADLFDCRGRQVVSQCFERSMTIDTAALGKGVYVVALSSGDGDSAQYPILLD